MSINSVETTVVVAILTAAAAILAPVISNFITAFAQLRIRKLELSMEQVQLMYPQKAAAFKELVLAIHTFRTDPNRANFDYLKRCVRQGLLFCEPKHASDLWKLLDQHDISQVLNLCDDVLQTLNTDLRGKGKIVQKRKLQTAPKRNK